MSSGGGLCALLPSLHLLDLLVRLPASEAIADPARVVTGQGPSSLWPYWVRRSCVVVLLQPLDQDHLHLVGVGHGCFLNASTTADSAEYTLRSPSTFGVPSSAPVASSTSPSAPGDPHLSHGPHGVAARIGSLSSARSTPWR
jgi:hypothetical protein